MTGPGAVAGTTGGSALATRTGTCRPPPERPAHYDTCPPSGAGISTKPPQVATMRVSEENVRFPELSPWKLPVSRRPLLRTSMPSVMRSHFNDLRGGEGWISGPSTPPVTIKLYNNINMLPDVLPSYPQKIPHKAPDCLGSCGLLQERRPPPSDPSSRGLAAEHEVRPRADTSFCICKHPSVHATFA